MTSDLSARLRQDPGLGEAIHLRARMLAEVRRHFSTAGFLEVTTPCLCRAADPAVHLDSFRTRLDHPRGAVDLYLPTSPEHHMKRMLAAGFGQIFQIGPFFRNGEIGALHNPEFSGLEWYEAGASVEQTMDRTEDLVRGVAQTLTGRTRFSRAGCQVDLKPPFRRMSVRAALLELAGVDAPADYDEKGLRAALTLAGIPIAADDSFDDLVNRALVGRVEPALAAAGPTFLLEYPAPMAAMARLKPDNEAVSERFELFAAGLELCNGYGELSDPVEQRARFTEQRAQRQALDKHVPPLDEAFLSALRAGMPAASGNALGLDRLLMLICEAERLDQVLAFPLDAELGWD